MAPPKTPAALIKLSDSNLTLTDAAEDIQGRTVLDTTGQEVGEVGDLLVDEQERKVRMLEVSSGGFLGLGATTFLLPVDAIVRITEDAVYISQARERIAGAPAYDPMLVDERYLSGIYRHYGYSPYWSEGYRYPRYPYYPE
jgi:sporulation protein YlmC with PRC-barrel domain